MKKLLAFVVILSVGLFTFAGCGETKKGPDKGKTPAEKPKDGGETKDKGGSTEKPAAPGGEEKPKEGGEAPK